MYLLRLKELRESRGLTQTELAQLMQVVPRQYQRYERGNRSRGWPVGFFWRTSMTCRWTT